MERLTVQKTPHSTFTYIRPQLLQTCLERAISHPCWRISTALARCLNLEKFWWWRLARGLMALRASLIWRKWCMRIECRTLIDGVSEEVDQIHHFAGLPDFSPGYDFMWANITSYNFGPKIYWNKIPILRDAFDRYPKAKWIWWLDLDIIIMTPSLDLYSHVLSDEGMLRNIELDKELGRVGGGKLGTKTIASAKPEDMHFLISSDNWGMNVGSFLMRRSYWSDWVLEMWADPLATSQGWIMPENDGWVHLYRFHKIVQNHTACLNQRALNAYPSYNVLGQHWQEGDLLVHFAGCG